MCSHYLNLVRKRFLPTESPNTRPTIQPVDKSSRIIRATKKSPHSLHDDLVVIEISDSEQIGTIVELFRKQLGENYTVDEHQRLVCEALTERGYSREVIDEWISYIE